MNRKAYKQLMLWDEHCGCGTGYWVDIEKSFIRFNSLEIIPINDAIKSADPDDSRLADMENFNTEVKGNGYFISASYDKGSLTAFAQWDTANNIFHTNLLDNNFYYVNESNGKVTFIVEGSIYRDIGMYAARSMDNYLYFMYQFKFKSWLSRQGKSSSMIKYTNDYVDSDSTKDDWLIFRLNLIDESIEPEVVEVEKFVEKIIEVEVERDVVNEPPMMLTPEQSDKFNWWWVAAGAGAGFVLGRSSKKKGG